MNGMNEIRKYRVKAEGKTDRKKERENGYKVILKDTEDMISSNAPVCTMHPGGETF